MCVCILLAHIQLPSSLSCRGCRGCKCLSACHHLVCADSYLGDPHLHHHIPDGNGRGEPASCTMFHSWPRALRVTTEEAYLLLVQDEPPPTEGSSVRLTRKKLRNCSHRSDAEIKYRQWQRRRCHREVRRRARESAAACPTPDVAPPVPADPPLPLGEKPALVCSPTCLCLPCAAGSHASNGTFAAPLPIAPLLAPSFRCRQPAGAPAGALACPGCIGCWCIGCCWCAGARVVGLPCWRQHGPG